MLICRYQILLVGVGHKNMNNLLSIVAHGSEATYPNWELNPQMPILLTTSLLSSPFYHCDIHDIGSEVKLH